MDICNGTEVRKTFICRCIWMSFIVSEGTYLSHEMETMMEENWKDWSLFILKKLGVFILTLFVLSVLLFVLERACPGDPLKAYYGGALERMSPVQKERARESLGLNRPVAVQYVSWAKNVAKGDWGLSYKYKRPVKDVVGDYWTNTLALGGISFFLLFVFSMWIGCWCALHENSPGDRLLNRLGVAFSSIPGFFIAMLMLVIFASELRILPLGGVYSYGGGGFADRVQHLILPVLTIVLGHTGYYGRLIRDRLTEETRKDYVIQKKASGMAPAVNLRRHCLKNARPQIIQIMALAAPHVLGGTYVAEMVFSYPGLGLLSFQAAGDRDYNMLMALTLITGVVICAFNMIAEIVSARIDPRTRHGLEAAA